MIHKVTFTFHLLNYIKVKSENNSFDNVVVPPNIPFSKCMTWNDMRHDV